MAPFARGIVRPRSAKMRALLQLSYQKERQPHFLHAPRKNLLSPPRVLPPLEKGNPSLQPQFDILNKQITGFRKYTPPYTPPPRVIRERNEKNFSEMLGKFRFAARGSFKEKGEALCERLLRVGRDLFLVGWIKCRARSATGHLQGDVYALSYMRRFLEKHVEEKILSLRFYEENFGMPQLEYERLTAVRDFRSPGKKQQHALRAAERTKALQLQQESIRAAQERADFYETHCVRSW